MGSASDRSPRCPLAPGHPGTLARPAARHDPLATPGREPLSHDAKPGTAGAKRPPLGNGGRSRIRVPTGAILDPFERIRLIIIDCCATTWDAQQGRARSGRNQQAIFSR